MILRTLRSNHWLKDFPKLRISCIFQLQHKMAGTQAGSDNNTKGSPEESNNIFCFELKGGPFYFTLQNSSEIGSKRQKFHYPQELQNCKEVLGMSSFAVSTDGKNTTNGLHSIKSSVIHNMIRHYSMRDRLKTMENNSSFLMDKRCSVIPTLTLDKNVEGDDRFCRGFAILVNEKGFPEDSVKDAVKEGIAEFDCLSFNRFVNEGDQIVHHSDTGVDNEETSSVVVPVPRPHIHPAFLDRETIGVFHSYERSVRILNECKHLPEVQESLRIAAEHIEKDFSIQDYQQQMKHPFIVLEGLDATGKSTLVEKLGQTLNSVVMRTPPDCVRHLREKFDAHPEILRRAYYSLGNYIVAKQIAEECQTRAVVMDRFWQSTAAYAIAHESGCGDKSVLPPNEHWVYAWPEDLIKPSAILFLTVNEDIRDERLTERNMTKLTHEEQLMRSKKSEFRERLLEAYVRMRDPAPIIIDASKSKVEVAEEAMEALRRRKLLP